MPAIAIGTVQKPCLRFAMSSELGLGNNVEKSPPDRDLVGSTGIVYGMVPEWYVLDELFNAVIVIWKS
jgi:hypothetical protein